MKKLSKQFEIAETFYERWSYIDFDVGQSSVLVLNKSLPPRSYLYHCQIHVIQTFSGGPVNNVRLAFTDESQSGLNVSDVDSFIDVDVSSYEGNRVGGAAIAVKRFDNSVSPVRPIIFDMSAPWSVGVLAYHTGRQGLNRLSQGVADIWFTIARAR